MYVLVYYSCYVPTRACDAYCVPRLAPESTVHSCITRQQFLFACKLAKNTRPRLCARGTSEINHGYSNM